MTEGKEGLDAALKSPLFNELYDLLHDLDQIKFSKLVNCILSVKSQIRIHLTIHIAISSSLPTTTINSLKASLNLLQVVLLEWFAIVTRLS